MLEVLVVMGIIIVISLVVLYDSPRLNENIKMNNAARALAGALRDAEARSVAVVKRSCSTSADPACFPKNYGIYVTTSPDHNTTFTLFTDLGASPNKYDESGICGSVDAECVLQYAFSDQIIISALTAPANPTSPSALNIIFYRPDPTVKVYDETGNVYGDPVTGPFTITIKNRANKTKTIKVWTTGQIAID